MTVTVGRAEINDRPVAASGRGRWQAALVAGALLTVWLAAIIGARGWNPSTLVAAGVDDTVVTSQIAQRLGPDFVPQVAWGHDGKFVFIQAFDPLLLNPTATGAVLDAPVYRSQRMLLPALLSPAGALGPWGVVWALPTIMVLAVAIGTWGMAGLAQLGGRPAWWGLLFMVNPGLFYAYRRGTVDVLAVALLVLGLYLVAAGRLRPAAAALVGAVLAKEVMILGVAGIAIGERRNGGRALPLLLWPVLVLSGWALYVRVRLGAPIWSTGTEVAGGPLAGFVSVARELPGADALVALAVAALAVLTAFAAVRRPSPATASGLGFAALLVFLPETVWGGYVDAWRASAPIVALLAASVLEVPPRVLPVTRSPAPVLRRRETEPSAA